MTVEQMKDELTELRQALGLLTTLHPTMEMDALHPLKMAKEIEAYVAGRYMEIYNLKESRDICRKPTNKATVKKHKPKLPNDIAYEDVGQMNDVWRGKADSK